MTARLRLVPIYGAEAGRHYLVLDRISPDANREQIQDMVDRVQKVAPEAIPLVTAFPVYIPQEDGDDPDAEPEVDDTTYADLAREASAGMNIVVNMDGVGQTIEDAASIGRQVQDALRRHSRVTLTGG